MSTETAFQVGDTVRVLPTEAAPHQGLHPNTEPTVEHADETHVRVSGSPYEWHARRFELVKRAAPTPSLLDQDGDDDGREAAPLDPKSVHVGDKVTVRFKETGDEIVTKAYQPDDITASGEYVYLLGWPLHRANGTFGLAFKHFEILAIEPAPEPEWKPGTAGTATVRTVPDIRVMRLDGVTQPWVSATFFAPAGDVKGEGQNRHDDWQVTDFVPDEPRPLPDREDVLQVVRDYWGHAENTADALLALLRGESR